MGPADDVACACTGRSDCRLIRRPRPQRQELMQFDARLYKHLLDGIHDGVYFTDRDRLIAYWNPGSQRLRASNRMTCGRDGPSFVAGQGARVMAHQRTDAPRPSNAGMRRKTARPFGLRLTRHSVGGS